MTKATIVYEDGSEVVEDFHFIEELNAFDEAPNTIRVWYSDPKDDDSNYTDYEYGNIVEVEG